jgi:hypothetical protein
MTDGEFIERFERGQLETLRHADHLHLACAYLNVCSEAESLRRLEAGLQAFATKKGVPEKFHRTLTCAWLELVVDARRHHGEGRTGEALLSACPALADPRFIHRFYSEAALCSSAARTAWIGPDLRPLDATLY